MTSEELVREMALLLLAADFVDEHPNAEDALVASRQVERVVETNPMWASGQHSGDCTREAHTCTRCLLEEYERVARAIVASDDYITMMIK